MVKTGMKAFQKNARCERSGTVLKTLLLFSLVCIVSCNAQDYTSASIFAHNDYLQPIPFHTAYTHQVGYIEADVFLQDGELRVAHHLHEIEPERTLDTLYLKPLSRIIRRNNGKPYESGQPLTLMIDIKSEGPPTLREIVAQLARYPELTTTATLTIMISGNVPDPGTWHEYPAFVTFDGRPGINYAAAQIARVSMISTSFRDHVQWEGRGPLPETAREKIKLLMQRAHAQGKPMRFWATPDSAEAWQHLMALGMDVIVTDRVEALSAFIRERTTSK